MQEKIFRFIIRFFSILPLPVLHGMGRLLGWLAYIIPNRERRTATVNLALCYKTLSEEQRQSLLKETLQENAITLLEMPAIWYDSSEKWLSRLDEGNVREEIQALIAQGKGLIVAVPHLGSFEISVHFLGSICKGTGLYRPPRKKGLESVMLEGRSRPDNSTMVPTTRQGIKALSQALAQNEMIVILPDQQPKAAKGGAGVFAPFFAVPALTMTLVNRFANKTGAPVYVISVIRSREKPGYKVIGQLADKKVSSDDITIAATALNQEVEQLVAQYPAQYQWTYRRFGIQPDGAVSPYKESQ